MATEEQEVFELAEDHDIEETDDGGAIVKLKEPVESAPAAETGFYDNLAGEIPGPELDKLALQLKEKIDQDIKDREDRDKQQAEAIKRTGLGGEAPGGASFMGASRAVHPMLAKAAIDFSSRMIAELFPPGGPVKDFIPGEPTKERVDKAKRKVAYMNWQFKVQMPESYSELEQLLTQDPLGGSEYLRLVYDERKKRPVPTFVAIDDVYLPSGASNYYTSERITYRETISKLEFDNRVRKGMYLKVPIVAPSMSPNQTESEKATDKVEGKKTDPMNKDGMRIVYLCECYLEIEKENELKVAGETTTSGTDIPENDPLPYLVSLDEHSNKILSIVRNWEEEDKTFEPIHWMIDFPFLPWRGAVGASLGQVIGSLAGSATGALRALLDSAHINNIPTLLKLKGANMPGQSIETGVGQIIEIEGGVAPDQDIRKLLMAIPYNEPSLVLLQLLGFLGQEADSVVRTTFEKFVESGRPDMPVGTTLALIEQGMKVLGGIHKRMHQSMDRVIRLLHKINKMYVTDEEIVDDTGELLAKRTDFEGPLDVVPVSDPEIFSDVQRFAQLQIVAQRAAMLPMLYDLRKVEEMILERTKIPEATSLLLPAPQPKEMNAVNENLALSLGRPVAAFPEQDHLAHIQVLIDYMNSPMFGMNALIAPRYLAGALQHLSEHMTMWYVSSMVDMVSAEAGTDVGALTKHKDPETRMELDRALAAASPDVIKQGEQVFAKLPEIIAKAQQMVQQYQQMSMPQDPKAAAQLQIAQINSQDKQAALASAERREQMKSDLAMRKDMTQAQRDEALATFDATEAQKDRMADAAKEQIKQGAEDRRAQLDAMSRERINTADNLTALTIAEAEIESGEKVAVEKGKDLGPNP
jgi:hypothetical protein